MPVALINSEKASGHPISRAMVRAARSVTPAIGASMTVE
jgi:cation transport ATPase